MVKDLFTRNNKARFSKLDMETRTHLLANARVYVYVISCSSGMYIMIYILEKNILQDFFLTNNLHRFNP